MPEPESVPEEEPRTEEKPEVPANKPKKTKKTTGTGPINENRLLHIGFLMFRVFWIFPQAFSIEPSLADAN